MPERSAFTARVMDYRTDGGFHLSESYQSRTRQGESEADVPGCSDEFIV